MHVWKILILDESVRNPVGWKKKKDGGQEDMGAHQNSP